MRIQWFNTLGQLDIEKGLMKLNVPFKPQETFQQQLTPPALVFTKPAIANGKLLGYVRVGHPLAEIQKQRGLLLQCLILGALVAVTASGVGMFLLVRQSLKPVEESIEHLQQFCADAAHELLTPITAIRTNSNVALRHPVGMREGDKEKFEAIASGALQIEKLTEDLLKLAKAEQLIEKKIDPRLTSLDLAEHVEDVLVKIAPGAEKKNLTLKNNTQKHLHVFMDGDDLDCVLKNLLDNAIKYTPDDGTISISAFPLHGGIRITVIDSGIGIGKDDLPKVFERFWRADQARSYHSGGNGLGLPIVKAIIDKYDGTITVASDPGKQTEFKIDLKGEKTSNGRGS
jgi:signal transduction histidine kinase